MDSNQPPRLLKFKDGPLYRLVRWNGELDIAYYTVASGVKMANWVLEWNTSLSTIQQYLIKGQAVEVEDHLAVAEGL